MKLIPGGMFGKPSDSPVSPSGGDPSPAADASPKAAGSPAKKGRAMKIGTKIFALVGFCLLLLSAVAGASIWQMNKIGMEIEGIAERDLPLTAALTQVTIHQLEQAINLERAFRAAEVMDKRHEAGEEFEKSVRTFEELNAKVEKEFEEVTSLARHAHDTAATQDERHEFQNVLKQIDLIAKEHKDYDQHAIEAFKLARDGQLEQALTLLPRIEAEQEELDHALEKLLVEVGNFTQRAAKTAENHEHFALKLLIAISLIALAIGTGSAVLLVRRSVSRPLTEIVTGLDALNADDMSVEVKVYNEDEIGAVAKAYAIFKKSLIRAKELEAEQEKQKQRSEQEKREMMQKLADDFDANVGSIVEAVSSASAELNTTAQSMAGIAEETNSQANAVAAASEQASSNVQTVASATEEMSTSIKEINGQIAEASNAAKRAVEDVSKTAGQMATLADTADRIGEVISMISDIAEQTNLLALNATIESARAGEAGKGFAVVANEVKGLANETAKATEGISKLIQEVQAETKTAVSAIGEIGTVISQLEQTSTGIAAAMEEQDATTQDVARNVGEAASGTNEVTQSIAGVTQASQEAGAASEQVTTAATELSQQAEMMQTQVAKFLEQIRAA